MLQLRRITDRFTMEFPPTVGVRESLQWFLLGRLALLFFLAGILSVQQIILAERFHFPLVFAYGLLSLCFLFNLINGIFLDRLPNAAITAAVHILFDIAIVSLWIASIQDRENLFALLYLIQILLAAIVFYQKGAWFSAVASSVAFGIVTLKSNDSGSTLLLTWMTFTGLFLIIGIVGGYLSEELSRTHERLQEKSRKLEKVTALHERILVNMPTGLLTVDREMRINFINPAGMHILGRTGSECIGKRLEEVQAGFLPFFTRVESREVPPPGNLALEPNAHIETLLTPNAQRSPSFFLHTIGNRGDARLQQRVEIKVSDAAKIIRGDVAPIDAEAGIGALLDKEMSGGQVLLFQDVTPLMQMEEKLRQSEKLAAVGQLAAGIAHEIRNPLASMSASIQMLRDTSPQPVGGENRRLMDIAIREIDRLNALISEFLDYVKPEKLRLEKVALQELLHELVSTAQTVKDRQVEIRFRETYVPGTVAHANAEKIKQVAWNLLINAIQSMRAAGAIELGCRAEGDRVKFWVADEGEGMSAEVMQHLFEPFFTTKERGTGLGLATAYKIVEAHGGEIRVRSEPGKGTHFDVFLQRAS